MNTTSFSSKAEMLTVLVVEDTPSERLFIVALLVNMGLKVTSCSCGEEALPRFRQCPTDIVISDWKMPGITGPQLSQQLKAMPNPPYIILLTANNQAKHMVQGIESGADDFLTKPFIPSILKVRLLAAARIVNMQHHLEDKNMALKHALVKEQNYISQIQADLVSAAKLQGALIPQSSPLNNDWQLSTRFQPALKLAGDIFQCFELDDSHLGFYLLDVAGHGIAASMQSFTLAQKLSGRHCPWHSLDPALIVTELNSDFEDPENAGCFVTLILGIANTVTGQIKLTNAGHPQPILIDNQHTSCLQLNSGLPLGIDKHYQYQYQVVHLAPKQHILLYSDGLYECRHPKFGEFGLPRLLKTISDAYRLQPEALLHHLMHAIELWRQKQPQDDISMMMISSAMSPAIKETTDTKRVNMVN